MKSPAIPLLEAYATALNNTISVSGSAIPYYIAPPEGTTIDYIILRDLNATPDDDKQTLSYSVDVLLEVITSNKGGNSSPVKATEIIDGIFNIIITKGAGFTSLAPDWNLNRSRLISQTVLPPERTESETINRHAILINHFIEEL
jgi:hypothetical protein